MKGTGTYHKIDEDKSLHSWQGKLNLIIKNDIVKKMVSFKNKWIKFIYLDGKD